MIGRRSRAAVAAVGAWLLGLFAAWSLDGALGPIAAGICAAGALAAVIGIQREADSDGGVVSLLAFAPLHLAVIATGGLASPVVALAGVWAVAVAWTLRTGAAVASCIAGALLLAGTSAAISPAGPAALAEVPLAIAAGCLLGAALRRATIRLRLQQRRLRVIEDEARRGMSGPASRPGERVRLLEAALESARAQNGAVRVVLWEVEAEAGRVLPRVAIPGPPPRPVSLSGSPFRWVWEERVPLRLEDRAEKVGAFAADGGACVVPVDDDTILAFEFEPGRLPPDVSGAVDAGRYIGALLELQRAQGGAEGARSRFDHLLGVLERLASATGPDEWAGELAETARVLAGGSGAAVGSWEPGGGGRVLASAGDDGGPALGQPIAEVESEMALAARAGSPIRRDELRPGAGRLPVASASERWFARPRALAVLPIETADGVLGVLAVWNADASTIDEAGLATLRTLAPYAALQMRQLAMHDTLRERAARDALTGLPNRRAFDERIEAEVAHFRRYRRPVSLILIDVDHFKRVNDTWGHDAGDVVLRQIARVLPGTVRETDFAARLGGEEFAVVLPETDLVQAMETGERIRNAVEHTAIPYGGETIQVRISGGVSACPAVVGDPLGLAASADAALYVSKQTGRNRITSASEQRRVGAGK